MAEMHPILWTRVSDRRLSAQHVRVAVLSTYEHRSFELSDLSMIFRPQTDLAILNYIANHKIFGTIDTREKFEAHRLQLANNEWRRLKANNSLECRNCHQFDSMDFTRQSKRAVDAQVLSLTFITKRNNSYNNNKEDNYAALR